MHRAAGFAVLLILVRDVFAPLAYVITPTLSVLAAAVLKYHRTNYWQSIGYAGRSKVETVMSMDGFVYRRETIPLLIECESDEE